MGRRRLRVLTDTHALVWALSNPELLGSAARSAMEDGEVVASVANLWELCLKAGKKDALIGEPLTWWKQFVIRTRVATLSIRTADVIVLGSLPEIHKDPFDRILVAQSISEGVPLVTKDPELARYGIRTIW
jgi:PIN domain nuclease of toxin-antitoxin system